MKLTDVEHLVCTIHADAARLDTGWRPDLKAQGLTLIEAITLVRGWAGVGYPTGGSNPGAGGDVSRIPEQIAVAGLVDAFGADHLEAEVTIRVVADGLRWLNAFVARNTPSRRNPDDRPTATCLDCGRTIADTPADPIKAGRCTYGSAIEALEGKGCYAEWERARKAQQRAREAVEWLEHVPGVECAG